MHVEAAGGELAAAFGGDVLAGAEFDEFAFAREAEEGLFEGFALFAAGGEFADQIFETGAAVGEALNAFEHLAVGQVE
jgi:hypothetical protein